MEDIFANLEFEDIEVGGFQFRFPIRYFDYSLMGAAFPAHIDMVQRALPSKKLMPAEIKPGIATVLLIATENRMIDGIKPYNEFDVMVPVRHETSDKGSRVSAFFCLHILVTTEEALVGGIEVYGYPKFLADISFKETDETRICLVRSEGKDIVTLEVRKSVTKLESYNFHTYSVKDGQLIQTLYRVQGQNSTNYIEGGASYTLGDDAITSELRALEMDTTSVMHRYAPQLKMLLHLPGERLPL